MENKTIKWMQAKAIEANVLVLNLATRQQILSGDFDRKVGDLFIKTLRNINLIIKKYDSKSFFKEQKKLVMQIQKSVFLYKKALRDFAKELSAMKASFKK